MQSRFLELDNLLSEHQSYWRIEPFQLSADVALPWNQSNNALSQWLESLTPEQIASYKENTNELIDVISVYLPFVKKLEGLIALPAEEPSQLKLEKGLDSGIPGRKLTQILSMGACSLEHHVGQEWLEWCSGKGYLGRILASESKEKVTSLEWQQELCHAGQQEADSRHLLMEFVQGDAFSEKAKLLFNNKQHAVSLHACGDLHVQLIHNATEHNLQGVTLSPCCYHLIREDSYQPLSQPARQSGLKLTKQELRIPLQETVTGGERVKRHRQQEMSYRLGLDMLLRSQANYQGYTPVPSIKKSELSKGFGYFCQWASEKREISLPEIDFDYWLEQGEKRFWKMEKISLVQQVFRRPLELWLVLDRALYLQENGYKVSVSTFCDRKVTPRNMLIHASLS